MGLCYPDKVIAVLEKEVGYLEKKSNSNLYDKTANAGSANYTKYAYEFDTKYPSFFNTKKQGAAWCSIVFSWGMVTAYGENDAHRLTYQPTKSMGAGCPQAANYYRNNNAFYSTPKVGDQIFFGTKGKEQHTGIVYKVDSSKVYTIEGNTSSASGVVANGGAVAKKSYPINYSKIVGYGRPRYDTSISSATTPAATPAPKKPTTTTNAGGYTVKVFKNTSGKTLTVYADTKKKSKVGTLYANTTCAALDQQGSMVCVRYSVSSGISKGGYKVGWVEYVKGVT